MSTQVVPPRRTSTKRFAVTKPTGGQLPVLSQAEKGYYERQSKAYQSEFKFTSTSDASDLDQLLFQELMSFRWSQALATRKDVDGDPLTPVMEDQFRRNGLEAARAIVVLKKSLGMSREARSEDADSVSGYIQKLRQRALEFKKHRDDVRDEIIGLFNELKSNVETFDRSNALEREKIGFEDERDLVEWVRSVALPKVARLNQAFLDEQKTWDPM